MGKLTRKQEAEFRALREERDMARALQWPVVNEPVPMKVEPGSGLVVGWHAFSGGGDDNIRYRVTKGVTDGINHSIARTDRTTSQGPGIFYRTEREALTKVRIDITRKAARRLAEIDKQIERI